MARFEDARRNLYRMEEELLAEEEEYDEELDEEYADCVDYEEDDWEEERVYHPRRRRRAGMFSRTVYTGEEFDEDAAVPAEEPNKKIGGLLLLAALEIGAIYAIVRWWLQWL